MPCRLRVLREYGCECFGNLEIHPINDRTISAQRLKKGINEMDAPLIHYVRELQADPSWTPFLRTLGQELEAQLAPADLRVLICLLYTSDAADE